LIQDGEKACARHFTEENNEKKFDRSLRCAEKVANTRKANHVGLFSHVNDD